MTLPDFQTPMSAVDALLDEMIERGLTRDDLPGLGGDVKRTGGAPKVVWNDVHTIYAENKKRVQKNLDRLSLVMELPDLVLGKRRGRYCALINNEDGLPHPLVRIVVKRSGRVTVLWNGEVWV